MRKHEQWVAECAPSPRRFSVFGPLGFTRVLRVLAACSRPLRPAALQLLFSKFAALPGLVHALRLPADTIAAAVELAQSVVVALCCGLVLPGVWSHVMLQVVADRIVDTTLPPGGQRIEL